MELLMEVPPSFDGVAKAFAMAKELPTTQQLQVRIGLAQDGALLAFGLLDGYRQVSLFAEHLRRLGWREHLLGSDDDMLGCDMLFSRPAALAQDDGDPSFIRRPVVERWPLEAEHAD
jgi:hypothetical protein